MKHTRSKLFDYSFLSVGLLIQVVTYVITNHFSPDALSPLSLVSGLLGVCSVCLAAQGNIWTYLFGFGQVGTYTWLCLQQRLYGEVAINAYYFLTMIYGIFVWRRRLTDKDAYTVTTRTLRTVHFLLIAAAAVLLSYLVGFGLERWTDDTQPYLDAFTTIPALVAQVLMILVYREHWYIWLAVDILSVVMWLRAGDYCMTAQYAFWCCNCVYGFICWRRSDGGTR
ncbi:MAG: nicotinamide mononucleotide transporter [Paludibacteraceae bacterium]|nr:nicotinamide mononucleotide transporter [Paludibacteraceae bacterium]